MPLMKAKRSPFTSSSGIAWPSCRLSCRLGVEEVDLRRRPGHEQVDDALRLRREVRRAHGERVGRPATRRARTAARRAGASSRARRCPNRRLPEEVAPRDSLQRRTAEVARRPGIAHSSLPRERRVEVQEHVRDHGQGRRLGRRSGRRPGRRPARQRAPARSPESAAKRAFSRSRKATSACEVGGSAGRRAGAEPVRVGDPLGGARARPRRAMRGASARAASTNTGSFSVVSACSGVFVRTRLTVHTSRLGASKVDEARVGRAAPDEGVEAAAVAVLARARLPLHRRCTARSRRPRAARGRRSGRRPSALQQPRRGERHVPHRLRLDAVARAAREQPVVGVALAQRGRRVRDWR